MASKHGGAEGSSSKGRGGVGMAELAHQLPLAGETAHYEPRKLTEEDFERYKNYVGQKWTGVCKWFNVSKGYGFIVPDMEEAKRHADDVFVHQSKLKMPEFRSLDEGEEVEFVVQLGKRGMEATDVCGIGGAPLRGHRIHPLGKRKEKEIRCYNCGQYGRHKASQCKRMPQKNVKACYICQSTDHLASECPNKEQKKGGAPQLRTPKGAPQAEEEGEERSTTVDEQQ